MDSDLKFVLANSILSVMIGFAFQKLNGERGKEGGDAVEIARLKEEFSRLCLLRESLLSADVNELQAVIDQYGPEVEARVAALRDEVTARAK